MPHLRRGRAGGQKGRGLGEEFLPALAFAVTAEFRIPLCEMRYQKILLTLC
jgi:hypothetical protein